MAQGKVKIIAEAGVNHNGSLDLASEMINQAKSFGADIIKFQSFQSNLIVTPSAEKASYQKKNSGNSENQFQMLKDLELSFDEQKEIKKMCDHCEIEFLSTPFDEESAKFLSSLGLRTIKIASGEITNLPLLEVMASKFDKIIMSTGMADLDEIGMALEVLLSKGVPKGRNPRPQLLHHKQTLWHLCSGKSNSDRAWRRPSLPHIRKQRHRGNRVRELWHG